MFDGDNYQRAIMNGSMLNGSGSLKKSHASNNGYHAPTKMIKGMKMSNHEIIYSDTIGAGLIGAETQQKYVKIDFYPPPPVESSSSNIVGADEEFNKLDQDDQDDCGDYMDSPSKKIDPFQHFSYTTETEFGQNGAVSYYNDNQKYQNNSQVHVEYKNVNDEMKRKHKDRTLKTSILAQQPMIMMNKSSSFSNKSSSPSSSLSSASSPQAPQAADLGLLTTVNNNNNNNNKNSSSSSAHNSSSSSNTASELNSDKGSLSETGAVIGITTKMVTFGSNSISRKNINKKVSSDSGSSSVMMNVTEARTTTIEVGNGGGSSGSSSGGGGGTSGAHSSATTSASPSVSSSSAANNEELDVSSSSPTESAVPLPALTVSDQSFMLQRPNKLAMSMFNDFTFNDHVRFLSEYSVHYIAKKKLIKQNIH